MFTDSINWQLNSNNLIVFFDVPPYSFVLNT